MSNELSGQVALVTGAATGIGGAIAEALASAGALVAVTDIDADAAVRFASTLAGSRGYRLDVRSADEAEHVVAQIEADLGPIEILCNNAGVATMEHLWNLTEEEWDLNMDVNAKGVFLVTRAVLPGMMARRSGRIVNTASMAGKRAAPLLTHYVASKWACVGFTKSAAVELGPYGIRVNCVCPGYVETGMQERELGWESSLKGISIDEVKAGYVKSTPLGRIELASDVAKAVLYLCSPASEFLTGVALDVTGGSNLT